MRRLSAVNVLRVQKTENNVRWNAAALAGAAGDTSLDPPARFAFRCLNHKYGCNKMFTSFQGLSVHKPLCKYTQPAEADPMLPAKPQELLDPKPHKCTKCYMRKGELRKHDKEMHAAVVCHVQGCPDKTIYHGEKALFRNHVIQRHLAKDIPHPSIPDRTRSSAVDWPASSPTTLGFSTGAKPQNYPCLPTQVRSSTAC